MLFLQAAYQCKTAELVNIANDLCGAYYLTENHPIGQEKRNPVTNVSKIKAFLKKANKVYGINKAKFAIKYALDNSFSPFESKIAVICVLPFYKGGFAVIFPVLNALIRLMRDAARYLGRDTCCCDLVWELQKVILEYDSNETHLQKRQHYYDKKKATVLTYSGYNVISATAEQFSSFVNIEKLFLMVRDQLGLRTHMDRFEKYREQRWDVYQQLFRS